MRLIWIDLISVQNDFSVFKMRTISLDLKLIESHFPFQHFFKIKIGPNPFLSVMDLPFATGKVM